MSNMEYWIQFFRNSKPTNSPLSTFDFESADSRLGRKLLSTSFRGFTLVELLIVLGVFTLLTGVVLSNYRTYNTNATFANASEDIVLALRQAQVYGAGVKGNIISCGGSSFNCSYGVHFSQSTNSIVLFADVDGNRVYTGADNPPVETITWGSTISIDKLTCGGLDCSTGVANVTFKRPNPDAYIADIPVTNPAQSSPYNATIIILKDVNTGRTATTTITRAGQISL